MVLSGMYGTTGGGGATGATGGTVPGTCVQTSQLEQASAEAPGAQAAHCGSDGTVALW